MNKFLKLNLFIVVMTIIITACGTTGHGIMYTERSIIPTDVKFQRVAILPNRLPLNLTDPETWKKFNFEVMKKRFEKEGFQVIDYGTSVEMFNKSGLPLEDTKISRDKYAELAAEMNADILVFPYYGTSYRITGITDKNNYEVVGSLQIYLGAQNDFMSRIDFDGNNYFSTLTKINTGVSLLINGILIALSFTDNPPDIITDPNFMIAVNLIPPIASLVGLFPYLTPANKRYQRAFRYAINKGLDQFFTKYQGHATTAVPARVAPAVNTTTNAPATKPVTSTPASEKALSSLTIEELQRLKQSAIDAKDFKKAAAVKEELDRRTKK